jgi:hypothetical protein
MTAWNDFVKKIYHEGHDKNKNYSFKQALQDASKRKGEMGSSSSSSSKVSKGKKSRKMGKKSMKNAKKGGTRRRRRH